MLRAAWVLLLLLPISTSVSAKVNLPVPTNYVQDYAGILTNDYERSINGWLQELENKTAAQVIVLILDTTAGVPIEQYAIELAENWKLGQKGKDNGMLFVLAMNEKRYRFEVGYGLEGFITDQYCGRLGRNVLTPYFKKGQYGQGILHTTANIAKKIASEYGVELAGIPKSIVLPHEKPQLPWFWRLLSFLFISTIFILFLGRGSFFWPLLLLTGRGFGAGRNPYIPGRRGFWGFHNIVYGGSSHSGGFGGGFGSFGGGGGGGFGGGGATGGW